MFEPNNFAIQASYRSKGNTKLARAVHGLLSHCSYDRHVAHRFALKLIAHQPTGGLDVAKCLVNFDDMIPNAASAYEINTAYRRQHDAVFQAFAAWNEARAKAA